MFKTTNMNGQDYVYIFLTAIIHHRQRHAGRGWGASVSVTLPLSLAEMTLRVGPVGVTIGSITHYYSPSHMHTHTYTHTFTRSSVVVSGWDCWLVINRGVTKATYYTPPLTWHSGQEDILHIRLRTHTHSGTRVETRVFFLDKLGGRGGVGFRG